MEIPTRLYEGLYDFINSFSKSHGLGLGRFFSDFHELSQSTLCLLVVPNEFEIDAPFQSAHANKTNKAAANTKSHNSAKSVD